MLRLRRYLKSFVVSIIIVIVVLFVQAMSDLNLPNYMSDIVNVGIQSGGIEEIAPNAISETSLEFMAMFMTEEEKELVYNNYSKIEKGNANYEEEYPLNKERTIYVIKDVDDETKAKLDNIFMISSETFLNVMTSLSSKSNSSTDTTNTTNMDTTAIDFSKIVELKPMVSMLPQQAINNAREDVTKNSDTFANQIALGFTKAYYKELGVDLSKLQMEYIVNIGIKMLAIALVGVIATIVVGFLSARVGAKLSKNLRDALFKKVQTFSSAEFDKFSTASLITRTTNDVTQVQMLVTMALRMFFYAPIMGIGATLMLLDKAPSMTWILVVGCILIVLLIVTILIIAMPKFNIMQKLVDRLNLVAREHLSGIMVIRAFGTQKYEEDRFDEANTNFTKNNLFVNRVMTFMMPCMTLIMNIVTLLIVWVGANRIADSVIQVGDMMAFMQYTMQVIMSFLMISMMFILIPRASVSAKRICEVLDHDVSIKDPKKETKLNKKKRGTVEFKNVSFKYDGADENVLENVSFVAKPGETLAIIGATGSGKSTLLNLIPRFYDVTEGKVIVNGVDVRNMSQKQLHDLIGYIPQKASLLSGTIKSNIKYANDAADDKLMEECAKVAQATEFIEQKEDKYDSEISQSAKNVSGGQKQRISIARALFKKAPIYIFDDSFSALDFKTDSNLRKELTKFAKDSTVIIVAQRVSTIMNADQILVLDDGKIVGKGTHKELLKKCPTYYEIASSQLGEEELNNG